MQNEQATAWQSRSSLVIRVLGCNAITKATWHVVPPCLSPHVLVQIRWQEVISGAMHLLQLSFGPAPVSFNMLGVDPRHWVNEVGGVVHSTIGHVLKRGISSPLIRVHSAPRLYMLHDDGHEGGSITRVSKLH